MKITAQHTPGPWITQHDTSDHLCVISAADTGVAVKLATVQRYMREHEHEANARLIAAAPELLAALKSVADESHCYPDGPRPYSGDSYLPHNICVIIRAAIAKAEGRA